MRRWVLAALAASLPALPTGSGGEEGLSVAERVRELSAHLGRSRPEAAPR